MSVENVLHGKTSTHPREVWTITSGDQKLAFTLVYRRKIGSEALDLERVSISFTKRAESIGLEYYPHPDKLKQRLYPYAANGEERPARANELSDLTAKMTPLVEQVNSPTYLALFREFLGAFRTVPLLEPGR